jgi:hypothetical protein
MAREEAGMSRRDEEYVLGICDLVLDRSCRRQHRFDFLRGDSGRHLPVDGYYPDLQLVLEYRERQHVEKVPFFDRRMTVSGVTRGEQRKIYDQRRRDVLKEHGIRLVELNVVDFRHNARKRLLREPADLEVVRNKLKDFL